MTAPPAGPPQAATGFRDQALARVTSAPPDADFHRAERRRWRGTVAGLARRLDELQVQGREGQAKARMQLQAFRAFLRLADPRWWRGYPAARLNARQRRLLRRLRKLRQRGRRRGWTTTGRGALELRLCDAIEVYTRRGDGDGVARCRRLLEAIADHAAEAAAARAER